MTTSQTTWSTIIHTVAQGIVWLAPTLLLAIPPSIGSLTVSGILSLGVAWLSHKYVVNATLAGTH